MSKRSELVAILAAKRGITKTAADELLLDVIDAVQEQVAASGESVLPKFGRFIKVDRPERPGRNPKTGEQIVISARSTVKFRQF